MGDKYKIDKDELSEILIITESAYTKIKSKDKFGSKWFEVYFSTEVDLNKTVNKLNSKAYAGSICKIIDQRIDLQNLMIYVIPFKIIQNTSDPFIF
jgi:hypothetical protein